MGHYQLKIPFPIEGLKSTSQLTIVLVLTYLIAVYTIYLAIRRGHGVEGTLAWIFAILAFPLVGPLAYYLLAGTGIRRTTRSKHKASMAFRQAILQGLAKKTLEPDHEVALLRMLSKLTGIAPSPNNSVEILAGDDRAFEKIESAINDAKASIWAEYYIIRRDATGDRFLALLAEKAQQGIDVKLLYDAEGSFRINPKGVALLKKNGGQAKVFLPLNPFRRKYSPHLRNHRKMVAVDGEIGFIGGMNVGDEYSGRSRLGKKTNFRDTHVSIRGPAVYDLGLIFAEDWNFATKSNVGRIPAWKPVKGGNSIVAVVPSGPDQEYNANGYAYFTGIAAARERVWLTSPYFIPSESIIRAMISAATRGMDVRLLVPAKNNWRLIRAAACTYYKELLEAGVRIFEYQPSMLHSKTMVVDSSWAIVGSANVDIRSFRYNFELGAVVVDPEFAKIMEKRFQNELRDSLEIKLGSLKNRPLLTRVIQRLARLLSPLL